MATVPNEAPIPANIASVAVDSRPRLEVVRSRAARSAQLQSLASSAPAGWWIHAAYMLLDLAAVLSSAYIAYCFRFPPPFFSSVKELFFWHGPQQPQYVGLVFLYGALTVLFCRSGDLYWTPRGRTRFEETLAVSKAVILATALLMVFVYLSGLKTISRAVVLSAAGMSIVSLAAWRLWKRHLVEKEIARGFRARNVLIVGAGNAGKQLAKVLEESPQLGYSVRGFLDQDNPTDPQVLGRVEALAQVARANFVDEIFITTPSDRELVCEVAREARLNGWNVKLIPDLYDGLGWGAPVNYVGEYPVLELHREPIPQLELFVKRTMDIIGSSLALVLLFPVMMLLAIAIKLDSPGPLFYGALRMVNERQGALFKLSNDPRMTRVGKWMRRYSLDELPQFWNVLKGDMSLVGPRPPSLDDYEQYRVDDLRRLDVTPGITGLWQITARRDPSFERILQLDLEYIETWTPWLDMKIILKTLPKVLAGEGQ